MGCKRGDSACMHSCSVVEELAMGDEEARDSSSVDASELANQAAKGCQVVGMDVGRGMGCHCAWAGMQKVSYA